MRKRPPKAMSVRLPDGHIVDAANDPPGPTETATLKFIRVLQPKSFDRCPLCGDPAATSEEHVPPDRLGGKEMTRTCVACNNNFGRLVEADLVDWYEDAWTSPSYASAAVHGKRKASRLLARWTPGDEFFLVQDGGGDPAIREILASGEVELEVSQPNEDRWRIALLKSMYLAVCLAGGIPEGEPADRVRAELLAVRNAKHREDVPPSIIARGLTVWRHRGAEAIIEDPVAIVSAETETGPLAGVLLAGHVFVSLSSNLNAAPPAPARRRVIQLHVGARLDGTITAVQPEPPKRESPQATRR